MAKNNYKPLFASTKKDCNKNYGLANKIKITYTPVTVIVITWLNKPTSSLPIKYLHLKVYTTAWPVGGNGVSSVHVLVVVLPFLLKVCVHKKL